MLVLLIIHNTGVRSHVFGVRSHVFGVRSHVFGVRSHRLRGLPGVAFGAGNLWRGGLFAASVPGSFSLTFSFSVFGGFGEIALQLEDVGRGEARA